MREIDLPAEQAEVYQALTGFFGSAEKIYPDGTAQIASVLTSLIGDQQVDRGAVRLGLSRPQVGLALLAAWLDEIKLAGAPVEVPEIRLGITDRAIAAVARRQIQFPSYVQLVSKAGRVDERLHSQVDSTLRQFSGLVASAGRIGLRPKEILGGLLAESIGSQLSARGSRILRTALEKPIGGHFEWLREGLGVADVAAKPGLRAPGKAPAPLAPVGTLAEVIARVEANPEEVLASIFRVIDSVEAMYPVKNAATISRADRAMLADLYRWTLEFLPQINDQVKQDILADLSGESGLPVTWADYLAIVRARAAKYGIDLP